MAGKMGSFITSSIGTMRVTEQIDALEVMGVNYLVWFPKIIVLFFISICDWIKYVFGVLVVGWQPFMEFYHRGFKFTTGLQSEIYSFPYICFIKNNYLLLFIHSFLFMVIMKGGALEVGKKYRFFCLDFCCNNFNELYINNFF